MSWRKCKEREQYAILVDFGFLNSSNSAKIQTNRLGWWNLEHYRGGLLDDGRQRGSVRSCGSLSNTRARKVEGVRAVGLIISTNWGVGFACLRTEDLGTLEVETTNTEIVSPFEVKENLM